MTRAEAASQYMQDEEGFFRTSHPGTYSFERLVALHEAGRVYAPYNGHVVVDEETRRVYASNGGNIGIKYYVEQRGQDRFVVTRAVDNLWDDIPGLGTIPSEDVNYPTQKTEGLLRRIIQVSTDPGDLVLDPFVGSGTTAVVAQQLDRLWIGCDDSWGAIRTTAQRLQRKIGDIEKKSNPLAIYRTETQTGLETGDGQAEVQITDCEDGVRVTIEAYRSETLAKTIRSAGEAVPTDWRALIQSVAIDPAYDGKVFRPVVVDVLSGKDEQVAGQYRLIDSGDEGARVCIQLVDILGQETLVICP